MPIEQISQNPENDKTELLLGVEEEQINQQPVQPVQKSPELIQKHRSSTKIIFHAIIACMGAFYFGYALGELNMAQPTLDLMYNMNQLSISIDLANGMLTGAMNFGGCFGCLVAGELLRRFGRRTIFYACDITAIIISLLFLIKSFYLAVFMRFCMGIIVGINSTVVPLYLREISPVSISGVIGIMNEGFINFGILSGYLLGLGFPLDPYESGEFYWRFVLAFPIVTSLIRIIGISTAFRKDTAVYYLYYNKFEKAKRMLFKVYKEEYQQEIYDYYHKAAIRKKFTVDTWSLVFSDNYRSRLLLGSLLQVIRQFSGMNAIIFYSTTIFENCFGDKLLANYMTVLSGIILTGFSFMSGILTKRFGRKPIILWGEIVLIVTLICTGIVSYISKDQVAAQDVSVSITILIITLIFIFEITFSLTIGSVGSVYNTDILNSEKALGLASSMNQVSSFLIGLLYPTLQSALGTFSTFFIFASFCVVGTIYFKIFLKETRGLQQTEIVDMFEKKKGKQIENGEEDENEKEKEKINSLIDPTAESFIRPIRFV